RRLGLDRTVGHLVDADPPGPRREGHRLVVVAGGRLGGGLRRRRLRPLLGRGRGRRLGRDDGGKARNWLRGDRLRGGELGRRPGGHQGGRRQDRRRRHG